MQCHIGGHLPVELLERALLEGLGREHFQSTVERRLRNRQQWKQQQRDANENGGKHGRILRKRGGTGSSTVERARAVPAAWFDNPRKGVVRAVIDVNWSALARNSSHR